MPGVVERHAEDALEVGEAVVAAEAGLVAEEQQHRGEGQRLRDDREVDALDARAEGEVAEDEGQQARAPARPAASGRRSCRTAPSATAVPSSSGTP